MTAGLSATNAQALIATYRALNNDSQRRALLQDPLGTLQELRQANTLTSPVLSSVTCRRRERYRRLQELLDEFLNEEQPGAITTSEARLLHAERKMLTSKIIYCAQTLSQSCSSATGGRQIGVNA